VISSQTIDLPDMNSMRASPPLQSPYCQRKLFTPSLQTSFTNRPNITNSRAIFIKSHNRAQTSIQKGTKQRTQPFGYRNNSNLSSIPFSIHLKPPRLLLNLQEESSNGTDTGKRTTDLEAGSGTSELRGRGTGHAASGGGSAGRHGVSGADGGRIGDHGDAGAAHDGGGGGGHGGGGGVVGGAHGRSDGSVLHSPGCGC